MSADRQRLVLDVFREALGVPRDERERWLASRLGDDEELRFEIRELLDAHDESGFLDRPLSAATDGTSATDPSGNTVIREDEIEPALRLALGDRYTLIEELGRGGMSLVFMARERKHDRNVVIKVLKPAVAFLYGVERFEREVQVAAKLAHPHILGLIDSGSDAGLLYYVMPYVESESLRDVLVREGRLPLPAAEVLLEDIAKALAHAHDQGIVHRDLKPGNVLCSDSHAYLMDFGIAKTLWEGDQTLTAAGHVMGTPRYMAPEQKAGDRDADHRADIFAWGLIAFEALMGSVPVDLASERVRAELAGERPEVPEALAGLIAACLRPDPRVRVASARDILAYFDTGSGPGRAQPRRTRPASGRRGVLAAGIAIAGLASAGWWLATRDAATGDGPTGLIAVAPFINETSDASLDPLGHLAADWITEGLQRAEAARVLPWPTVLEALGDEQGRTDAVARLADRTGAELVVTGSFYDIGGEIQFAATVTEAAAGTVLTSLSPIAAPRDEAQTAIQTLRDRLMAGLAIASNERLAAVPGLAGDPPTFEAYRAFDRGMRAYVEQDYRTAAAAFADAYRLDTTFLVPLLYEATTRYNTGERAGMDSILALLEPERDRLSEYQENRLALLRAMLDGEGERALRLARTAMELGPGGRAAYTVSLFANGMNRPAEAVAALEAVDPDGGGMRGWAQYWTQLGHARHLLGRWGAERAAAREMWSRYPERRVATVIEARALAASGDLAALDSALIRIDALPPRTYWSYAAASVTAGEELWAHGDSVAGTRYLERGVEWLETQRAAAPEYAAHRYWLGSALYDLGRWQESVEVFEPLVATFPGRLDYAGPMAVALARAGLTDSATAVLGPVPTYDRADHLAYRARLESVIGDPERAIDYLSEALRTGFDGYPWLHASSIRDLGRLADSPRFRELVSVPE